MYSRFNKTLWQLCDESTIIPAEERAARLNSLLDEATHYIQTSIDTDDVSRCRDNLIDRIESSIKKFATKKISATNKKRNFDQTQDNSLIKKEEIQASKTESTITKKSIVKRAKMNLAEEKTTAQEENPSTELFNHEEICQIIEESTNLLISETESKSMPKQSLKEFGFAIIGALKNKWILHSQDQTYNQLERINEYHKDKAVLWEIIKNISPNFDTTLGKLGLVRFGKDYGRPFKDSLQKESPAIKINDPRFWQKFDCLYPEYLIPTPLPALRSQKLSRPVNNDNKINLDTDPDFQTEQKNFSLKDDIDEKQLLIIENALADFETLYKNLPKKIAQPEDIKKVKEFYVSFRKLNFALTINSKTMTHARNYFAIGEILHQMHDILLDNGFDSGKNDQDSAKNFTQITQLTDPINTIQKHLLQIRKRLQKNKSSEPNENNLKINIAVETMGQTTSFNAEFPANSNVSLTVNSPSINISMTSTPTLFSFSHAAAAATSSSSQIKLGK